MPSAQERRADELGRRSEIVAALRRAFGPDVEWTASGPVALDIAFPGDITVRMQFIEAE